jgi:hypothetical protein
MNVVFVNPADSTKRAIHSSILLQFSSYNEYPLAAGSCSHLLGRHIF